MHGFSKQELLELAWQKPILAQLEITNRCNQNCIFCYSAYEAHREKSELTLEQWQIIIDKLQSLGVRRLDFTGRESFLSGYLHELLKFCRKKGFSIKINTNGTLDVSGVLDCLDEIVFSVHGLGQVHENIVGYPGSFSLLESNFKRTVAAGVKASVNMSLVKANYRQLLEVFHYFDKKYGVHKFAPSIPVPSLSGGDFTESALVMSRELLEDYINNLKMIPQSQIALKHGFHSIYLSDSDYYRDNGLLLPNCAAGKYKLVVKSDGKVFPCGFFVSDDFCCGNLLDDDENEIWQNGKGFVRFRQLVLQERIPEQCKSCLKKPRCFSGCRAWSETYREGGFEYAKDQRCGFGSSFIGS